MIWTIIQLILFIFGLVEAILEKNVIWGILFALSLMSTLIDFLKLRKKVKLKDG